MTSQRNILTPIFAAAVYACACLLICGTGLAVAQPTPATRSAEHSSIDARRMQGRAAVQAAQLTTNTPCASRPDEALLSRNIKVSYRGEQVIPGFAISREIFCALLSRQLADY